MKTLRSDLPFGFKMRMRTTVNAMQIETGAAACRATDASELHDVMYNKQGWGTMRRRMCGPMPVTSSPSTSRMLTAMLAACRCMITLVACA